MSDRWSRCPGCWHRLHRATPRHGDRADGPPGRRTRRARSSRGLRGAHRFLRLRSMRSVRSGGSGVHSLAGSCQTASRRALTAERPDPGGSPASGRSFTIRVRGPVAFSGPRRAVAEVGPGGAGPSHRPGPALRRARGSPPERSFRGTFRFLAQTASRLRASAGMWQQPAVRTRRPVVHMRPGSAGRKRSAILLGPTGAPDSRTAAAVGGRDGCVRAMAPPGRGRGHVGHGIARK